MPPSAKTDMRNPFVYVQLQTSDLDRARGFYSALFDWTIAKTGNGPPYFEIGTGEEVSGGMMQRRDEQQPSQWIPYVRVEVIRDQVDQARDLGAQVLVPPTQIPKRWYSLLSDPTGALVALTQPIEVEAAHRDH